jgi:hypothetical protein
MLIVRKKVKEYISMLMEIFMKACLCRIRNMGLGSTGLRKCRSNLKGSGWMMGLLRKERLLRL